MTMLFSGDSNNQLSKNGNKDIKIRPKLIFALSFFRLIEIQDLCNNISAKFELFYRYEFSKCDFYVFVSLFRKFK